MDKQLLIDKLYVPKLREQNINALGGNESDLMGEMKPIKGNIKFEAFKKLIKDITADKEGFKWIYVGGREYDVVGYKINEHERIDFVEMKRGDLKNKKEFLQQLEQEKQKRKEA